MADLAKAGRGWCANTPAGAVITHKIGEGGLKIAVAGHQRVIIRIADRRVILAMIAFIMPGDGGGKGGQFRGYGVTVHLGWWRGTRAQRHHRLLVDHPTSPAGPVRRRGPRR